MQDIMNTVGTSKTTYFPIAVLHVQKQHRLKLMDSEIIALVKYIMMSGLAEIFIYLSTSVLSYCYFYSIDFQLLNIYIELINDIYTVLVIIGVRA